MQTFFQNYIDLFALICSVIYALWQSISTMRNTSKPLRPIAVFFMYFGPAAIVVHMGAHLANITYNSVVALIAGSFEYNFRFYSLILMGVVFGGGSLLLMRKVKAYLTGQLRIKTVLQTMLWISLFTLPTVPFTPIGSLPALACLITLAAYPFARKRRHVVSAVAASA